MLHPLQNFNMKLKNTTKKIIIPFLGVIVIATLWHGEKTKKISQYGAVFYELGLQCKDQCGQDKQIQYFKKAIYYNPSLSVAHYQLALIYEKIKDDVKSLEYFRTVAELDHGNVLAAYRVGRQHFREDSYDHALKYFLRCYQRIHCPDDIGYYLARIYDQKKDYLQAARHYRDVPVLHDEYAAEFYSRWVEGASLFNFGATNTFPREIDRLRAMSRPDLADLLEKTVKAAQTSEASGTE